MGQPWERANTLCRWSVGRLATRWEAVVEASWGLPAIERRAGIGWH